MLELVGLCTETAGTEMQLPEEWSQGLQRGRFAEQQKRAEEEAKSFRAEPCRGESRRARARRAAERAGMSGREGSSRDKKPGLGPAALSSARWDSEN